MQEPESLPVDDLESLLRLLEGAELSVVWRVLSDIGPEWIGGGTSIQFYLGDRPLGDTPFHDRLKEALIRAAEIPAESPDAVIRGEGDIRRTAGALEIEYSWNSAVPYADPRESGHGVAVLIDLSNTR